MIPHPMAGMTRLRATGVLRYMGWVYRNKGRAWVAAVRRRDLTNRILMVEP